MEYDFNALQQYNTRIPHFSSFTNANESLDYADAWFDTQRIKANDRNVFHLTIAHEHNDPR